MGFRRDCGPALRWSRWARARETLIRTAGLPADVVASQRAFEYFIGHGYNAAGYAKEQPWFEVEMLTAEQLPALKQLVIEYVHDFYPPPLPGRSGWMPLSWLWKDDGCST